MSFRHYLYVSDSKVDMLLAQIDPTRIGRRTAEVGVTLKIFNAKRSMESSVEVTRFARLERVVRHLEDFGDLGSIAAPGQFFGGAMPALLDGLAAEPEIGDLLGVGAGADEDVLRAVELANAGLRGPVQNVEFVAKRLLHGRLGDKDVVLGSPLYVALLD